MDKLSKRGPEAAIKQALAVRDRAMAAALKRKEEYLGARVPRELKQRVIERANELNIPVSLLIRRVLEEKFSVSETPAQAQTSVEDFDGGVAGEILAWKRIELNRDHACDRCGVACKAGEQAVLGMSGVDDKVVIVCDSCKSVITKNH